MTLIRLSKAAEINPPGPKGVDLNEQDRFDFVPMAAVRQDGYIDHVEQRPYAEVFKGYTNFKDNDILVAKITPCFENNKIALARTRSEFAFGSTEFHVIRCMPGKLEPRYLLHLLRSDPVRHEGERRMTGSAGQKRVPRSFFEELELPIPEDIEEQRRIAAILDKADAIRGKREQSLALADDLLKSAFLHRFGDPASNPRKLRTKPIKALGEVVTGNTPSRRSVENYGDGIEWIKSDNINTPSHLLTIASERLSAIGERLARKVPADSTLVTCIAGSPDCIGNAAMTDREVAFNQQINAIIPNPSTDPHFLYSQVLVAKKLIQRASTNSMKGMVSKGRFQEIEFLAPDEDEQRRFGAAFKEALGTLDVIQKQAEEASQLFASLSQRAFRGEL